MNTMNGLCLVQDMMNRAKSYGLEAEVKASFDQRFDEGYTLWECVNYALCEWDLV